MKSSVSHRYIKLISLVLSVLLLVALFTSCKKKEEDEKVSPDWYSERHSLTHPVDEFPQNNDKAHSTVRSYAVPLNEDELLAQSGLVAIGKVLGFDYLTLAPFEEDSKVVYTDYYVEVIESLRGEPKTGENGLITIRTQGGENDDEIAVNGDLRLNVGDMYLFFLTLPASGGYNVTEGGKTYLPINMGIGVFTGSSETVKNDNGDLVPELFTSYENNNQLTEKLDYADFSGYAKSFNGLNPVVEDYFRQIYLDNYDHQLSTDSMSQDEYDAAIRYLNAFATILNYTE